MSTIVIILLGILEIHGQPLPAKGTAGRGQGRGGDGRVGRGGSGSGGGGQSGRRGGDSRVGRGGSGGGGGGQSGRRDDYYNRSAIPVGPICSSNCRRCTSDYTCDVCDPGYTRINWRCAACGRHCHSCHYAGPGYCDDCYDRYVLTDGRCKSCADNCKRCELAGAYRCDQCDDGYLRSIHGLCQPCASGCKVCHDTSRSGCDRCFSLYDLQRDGSCAFNLKRAILVPSLVVLCLFCCCMCLMSMCLGLLSSAAPSGTTRSLAPQFQQPSRQRRHNHNSSPEGREDSLAPQFQQPGLQRRLSRSQSGLHRYPPSHLDYISHSLPTSVPPDGAPNLAALPTGIWRGYYTCSGTRHDVCEFNLNFAEDGRVTGEGVDDVGGYVVSGLYRGVRLAFSKRYVARSLNTAGVVSFGNQGHTVEYRGALAGASMGNGFRGAWTIRSTIGDYDGDFHIWPAMEGFADTGNLDEEGTFEENECVVCYDRPISTCLRPCGHIALCSVCASRLRPRMCPLCRGSITRIENRAPVGRADPIHED